MKIAIGLYGKYNNLYKKIFKKNNQETDFFAFTLTQQQESIYKNFKASNYLQSPLCDILPRINTEHQKLKRVLLYDYCCKKLVEMMDIYSLETEKYYDIKIFTNFKTLLISFPSEPGIYYTPYYSFTSIHFPNPLKSIEIISNTHVRINGSKAVSIQNLDLIQRKYIFDTLFDGKVNDFFNFNQVNNIDIAFIIPSVINTSNNSFDYISYRSVFSHKERLEQTLQQIQSIQSINMDNKINIFLAEGSILDLDEMSLLSKNANIILFSKQMEGYRYANIHKNKSIFEVYVLKNILCKITAKWYFKFGGRYSLLINQFNLTHFLKDKPVMKIINEQFTFSNQPIIECILYSFPNTYKSSFEELYSILIKELNDTNGSSVETCLLKHIMIYNLEIINTMFLGVIGKDAIEAFDNIV